MYDALGQDSYINTGTGRDVRTMFVPDYGGGNREERKRIYRDWLAETFGTQLDAASLSSRLWPYMDPDNDAMPMRKPATLVSGPYGKFGGDPLVPVQGGTSFWNVPPDERITAVVLNGNSDDITGMSIELQGGTFDLFGMELVGGFIQRINRTLFLRDGCRIVKASGYSGYVCHGLRFETNRPGVKIEKGRLNYACRRLRAHRSR